MINKFKFFILSLCINITAVAPHAIATNIQDHNFYYPEKISSHVLKELLEERDYDKLIPFLKGFVDYYGIIDSLNSGSVPKNIQDIKEQYNPTSHFARGLVKQIAQQPRYTKFPSKALLQLPHNDTSEKEDALHYVEYAEKFNGIIEPIYGIIQILCGDPEGHITLVNGLISRSQSPHLIPGEFLNHLDRYEEKTGNDVINTLIQFISKTTIPEIKEGFHSHLINKIERLIDVDHITASFRSLTFPEIVQENHVKQDTPIETAYINYVFEKIDGYANAILFGQFEENAHDRSYDNLKSQLKKLGGLYNKALTHLKSTLVAPVDQYGFTIDSFEKNTISTMLNDPNDVMWEEIPWVGQESLWERENKEYNPLIQAITTSREEGIQDYNPEVLLTVSKEEIFAQMDQVATWLTEEHFNQIASGNITSLEIQLLQDFLKETAPSQEQKEALKKIILQRPEGKSFGTYLAGLISNTCASKPKENRVIDLNAGTYINNQEFVKSAGLAVFQILLGDPEGYKNMLNCLSFASHFAIDNIHSEHIFFLKKQYKDLTGFTLDPNLELDLKRYVGNALAITYINSQNEVLDSYSMENSVQQISEELFIEKIYPTFSNYIITQFQLDLYKLLDPSVASHCRNGGSLGIDEDYFWQQFQTNLKKDGFNLAYKNFLISKLDTYTNKIMFGYLHWDRSQRTDEQQVEDFQTVIKYINQDAEKIANFFQSPYMLDDENEDAINQIKQSIWHYEVLKSALTDPQGNNSWAFEEFK